MRDFWCVILAWEWDLREHNGVTFRSRGASLHQDNYVMGAGSSSFSSADKKAKKCKKIMGSGKSSKCPLHGEGSTVEIGANCTDTQSMAVDKFADSALIGSSKSADMEFGSTSSEQEISESFVDDFEDPYDEDDDCDYDDYMNQLEEYASVDNSAKKPIDNYDILAAKFDGMDMPAGVELTVACLLHPPPASKSYTPALGEIAAKYNNFQRFDTVEDFSGHHYFKNNNKKPLKAWASRIQQEWKVLEKDLPESIYVRVHEERMDLLQAAIVGPDGTPYHDGLFFFDVCFPENYPNVPPKVHYHSGGLRLNPNLYSCGKVCLSLLGTWSGSGCEKWSPDKSTILQVLVSIQGLVLNEKPYFNEPGLEISAGKPQGEKSSVIYNNEAFLLSCKTMLYSLRRPPKNFQDLVDGHFRMRGRNILIACLAYMKGAAVGSALPHEVPEIDPSYLLMESLSGFQKSLKKLYEDLLMELTVKQADCGEFLAMKAGRKAAPAETSSSDTLAWN